MYSRVKYMFSTSKPIGIFDSGVGGLTVMHQLMQILPKEQFIYFGDTARIPYGNKSSETIIQYSLENTLWLIKKEIKLLIIACNTASAHALAKMKEIFPIPILGVIEAGAEKAVEVSPHQQIAVLGTKGTIQSGAYQTAILKRSPQATILPIACPLFVPLVEEQWFHHRSTRLIVEEYLKPIKKNKIDTVLLGCTHYPLLRTLIQEELGEDVRIVDSASTCANHVAKELKQQSLLSPFLLNPHEYFVSDDPEKFRILAEGLFGQAISKVELVSNLTNPDFLI